ncbi:hypothetical protein AAHE18_14G170600 [Arachis hypogaea]
MNNQPSNLAQDTTNSYYIHPSENSTLVLVTPVLTGNSYYSWNRSFTMAMISKNKYGFLIGSISSPLPDDPLFSAWERCNKSVLSWLFRSLSPSITQSVIYFATASSVWTDLKEQFAQSDLLRIAELQEEIYALKQGTLSVTEFYTSLKSLWEELVSSRPLPHPSQGRGRGRNGFSSGKGRSGFSSSVGRVGSSKFCAHCGHSCHTIEVCYSKYGYLPGHPRHPGSPHHSAAIAATPPSIPPPVYDERAALGHVEGHTQQPNPNPILDLSLAQQQALIALLKKAESPSSKYRDNGSSNQNGFLPSLISPIIIHLPNNTKVTASYKGQHFEDDWFG